MTTSWETGPPLPYGHLPQMGFANPGERSGVDVSSVRQLADESGAVTLAQAYEPYGSPAALAGTASSMYGFTGEQQDATGLVYLRARYYYPITGRFVQADDIVPNPRMPADWNRYLYARGNPIAHIDPSGHTAECGPFERADLTQWMIDELNADRDSWIIGFVRTNLALSALNASPRHIAMAYFAFSDAVAPHHLWDFKDRIGQIVGENTRIADKWYTFDVPGNVAFGYLGMAAGIGKRELHCGADAVNDKSPLGFCSGNDPMPDRNAIEAGFDLWRITNGGPVSLSTLSMALQKRTLSVGRPTFPSGDSVFYWPYTVGTFDGTGSRFVHR
jgi:RHS repeat-associated protein